MTSSPLLHPFHVSLEYSLCHALFPFTLEVFTRSMLYRRDRKEKDYSFDYTIRLTIPFTDVVIKIVKMKKP